MQIIQLKVNLAFEDFQVGKQAGDFIADQISELCFDKLGAEVCGVKVIADYRVNVPDFSGEADLDDAVIEGWQKAAKAMFTYPEQTDKQQSGTKAGG